MSDPAYLLTVLPGLEAIAADEAARKVNAAAIRLLRGKVVFTAPPFDCARLRCADNVYAYLQDGEAGTTRAALQVLQREIRTADAGRFVVNAAVAGRHNYSRFEAAAACGAALTRQGLWPGTPQARDVEYRLDITDGAYLFSRKLTDAAFRFRGPARLSTKAALRPTVAAALVWASRPASDDLFADPFCGSGSIVTERAAYPHRRITGVDIDGGALAVARHNAAGLGIDLLQADSPALAWPEASVNAIVTNPPWGGQIPSGDLPGLYARFMRWCRRVLAPDGRVVALTPLGDALTQAAAAHGFAAESVYTVSLHGTVARVFVIGYS